jgi:NAD(P)-dependent dehydrogenase (short-subunit alcohol dehydrogenase family)
MLNLLDFTGKQILIAGGAKGIGKETGVLLSKLGAKVVLLDLRKNELIEALSIFKGEKHCYYEYDLSITEGIEPLIKEIISKHGPFDGFVHCVGVRSRRPLLMTTPKVISEILNVNFGSFIELVRCITKKNNFKEGLSIVGISSISSQIGHKSVTAYAASKAAMDCAVRCLAKELGTKKIRLNTVVPSTINTHVYKEFTSSHVDEEDSNNILNRQYLGLGEPIDVANAIAFLLSSSSRFITGSAIPVDGGFLSS